MRHLHVFVVVATAAAAGGIAMACSSATTATDRVQGSADASPRVEGGVVDLPEGGASDAGVGPLPEPSCVKYCALVMGACKDEHRQYASKDECLATCALLPKGTAGETDTSTVACRELYADSPARTDAVSYCLAAGPFGGNVCGDRCTAFCQLTLAACSPDAGNGPYRSYADCQTACSELGYADAGGEGPDGPSSGDTLNCRLYHLRAAVKDGSGCAELGADSGACR